MERIYVPTTVYQEEIEKEFRGYVHTKDKREAYELRQRGGKVIEINTPRQTSYFVLDGALYNAIATSEGLRLEYATYIKNMIRDLQVVLYKEVMENGGSEEPRLHKHIVLETLTLAYHDLLLNQLLLTPAGDINKELIERLGFTTNAEIKRILDDISMRVYRKPIENVRPKHIEHIDSVYNVSTRRCERGSHYEVIIEVKKEQIRSNIAFLNKEYSYEDVYQQIREIRSYVDLSGFDEESATFIEEHLESITALYINLMNEGGKIPVLPPELTESKGEKCENN